MRSRRTWAALGSVVLLLGLLPGLAAAAPAGAATSHAGPCVGTEGVTVVVDFGYVAPPGREEPVVRCAVGAQATGWDALVNAGITVGSVPGWEGGAVCQLEGVPTQGFPYCWTGEGYWSYWHGEPGQTWTFSNYGAAGRTPPVGTADGWRFVPLAGASVPPRRGPTFVAGVDVTAPVLTITDGPSAEVPAGQDVVFDFTVDDLGATLTCRLDDGAWEPCDTPTSWDATVQRHTFSEVEGGEHVFTARAVDTWGNEETATRTFGVTRTPASVSAPNLTSVAAAGATLSATVTAGNASQRVRVEHRAGSGPVVATAAGTVAAGTSRTVSTRIAALAPRTGYRARVVTADRNDVEVASAWVDFTTTRPAARLTTRLSQTHALRGRVLTVTGAGLVRGERYELRFGTRVVASGAAGAAGRVTRTVRIPARQPLGATAVRLVGSQDDRVGSAPLQVLAPRTLGLRLRASRLGVRRTQVARVSRLSPGEPVVVRLRGKVVARGQATRGGRFVARFPVGARVGKAKVLVHGAAPARSVTRSFTVRR